MADEARLDSLEKEMKKVIEAIWGNGRPGLRESVARFEEHQAEQGRTLDSIDRKLDELGVFGDHIKDKQQHDLWNMFFANGPKKIAAAIGIATLWQLAVHALIPNDFSLWEAFTRWLGL